MQVDAADVVDAARIVRHVGPHVGLLAERILDQAAGVVLGPLDVLLAVVAGDDVADRDPVGPGLEVDGVVEVLLHRQVLDGRIVAVDREAFRIAVGRVHVHARALDDHVIAGCPWRRGP